MSMANYQNMPIDVELIHLLNLLTSYYNYDDDFRFYAPIIIAEIFYRDRTAKDIEFTNIKSYSKVIPCCRDIICSFFGTNLDFKRESILQLIDGRILSSSSFKELANINRLGCGIVEVFIYNKIKSRFGKLSDIRSKLTQASIKTFDFQKFIEFFAHPSAYHDVGKAYEIAAYALFDTILGHLKTIVLNNVDKSAIAFFHDISNFIQFQFSRRSTHHKIFYPAKLYRVGTANAADAGLDMWANFGPAIQVKHITLSLEQVGEITERIMADQVVIVCKKAEARVIDAVMRQTGLNERIRGFITEVDLINWYELCQSKKYRSTLGEDLIKELGHQFDIEFPASNSVTMEEFFRERAYKTNILRGEWTLNI